MIERLQRPLIDRPRYVSKLQNNVNTIPNKVVNKEVSIQENQIQQPISGSVNSIDEDIKVKQPINLKPSTKRKTKKSATKRKTKKPATLPHQLKTPKKNEGGVLKQMKDKFIGKSKGKGGN